MLSTTPVHKLLFRFAIPAIIGTMVFASTNIVNTVFIGRFVGSSALTAISLTFPIFAINMAVGMLVGMGSGALISIRLGEGKRDEAERILGNAFFLFIVLGLTMSIIGLLFLKPILTFLGASGESLPYAISYMQIIFPGVVLTYISMGLNNVIRAEGYPSLAMNTMLIGALLNVALNFIFVVKLSYGVRGAALATFISSTASSIWVLYHFFFPENSLHIKKVNLGFERRLMQPALLIGTAPFLMQLVASLVGVIANKQLAIHGGDKAIACMGIIYSVMMLLIFPIIAINQGVQPILGFNYGAKLYKRVQQALLYAIVAASLISIIGFTITQLFPAKIFMIFSKNDSTLTAIGSRGLQIFFHAFFLVGFQAISANYFQAVGRPKTAILLNLLRQAMLFIPLLLILPNLFGLSGIWWAAPISDFTAFIITIPIMLGEVRRLEKKIINHGEITVK